MTTTALTLGKAVMRDFYRCYILPQHIEKAKANGNKERQASLEAELKRRTKAIAAADLKEQYAAYVKAQKEKQAKWDAYAALKSGLEAEEDAAAALEVLGVKIPDKVLVTDEAIVVAAQAAMLESREAFRAKYERF